MCLSAFFRRNSLSSFTGFFHAWKLWQLRGSNILMYSLPKLLFHIVVATQSKRNLIFFAYSTMPNDRRCLKISFAQIYGLRRASELMKLNYLLRTTMTLSGQDKNVNLWASLMSASYVRAKLFQVYNFSSNVRNVMQIAMKVNMSSIQKIT